MPAGNAVNFSWVGVPATYVPPAGNAANFAWAPAAEGTTGTATAVIAVGSASTGATRVAGEGSAPVEISSQSAAAAWVRGVVAGLVEVSSIGHGRVGQRKVDGDVSVVTLLREISVCPPRNEAVATTRQVQVNVATTAHPVVAIE